MKPTTLVQAIGRGAKIILRGFNRAYAPGDTAFKLELPIHGPYFDGPPGSRKLQPVVWIDGRWERQRCLYRATICHDEIVTVVE